MQNYVITFLTDHQEGYAIEESSLKRLSSTNQSIKAITMDGLEVALDFTTVKHHRIMTDFEYQNEFRKGPSL